MKVELTSLQVEGLKIEGEWSTYTWVNLCTQIFP